MKKFLLLTGFAFIAVIMQAQTFQWAKSLGGLSNEDGRGVVVDAAGNVYTTGYFTGNGDFDPGAGVATLTSAGSEDVYISKLDASGNFIWAKRIGGVGADRGWAIALDDSGNVYTTGQFSNSCDMDPGPGLVNINVYGGSDIFILKLNPAGNYVWAQRMGGTSSEAAYGIKIDAFYNVLTTGVFNGTADFDPGSSVSNHTSGGGNDVFISKLNPNGGFVWSKTIGINGADYGNSLTTDAAGNVYVTGVFESVTDFDPGAGVSNLISVGFTDAFVLKLNAAGNFVWAQGMGGTSSDIARSISLDAAGNVLTTGEFQGTVDFDPGAGTFNLTSLGTRDIYVSKLSASGSFIWATAIGSTMNDAGLALAVDANNNIYVTGYFIGTVDFDPGVGNFLITSAGSIDDIFILKLDAAGTFVWAERLGAASSDISYSIFVDAANNVYTTGYYQGTVDFDPGTGIFNLTASAQRDAFVHKMSQATTTNINELTPGFKTLIYPNPAISFITISTDEIIENITICNLLGEVVQQETASTFSLEQLVAGVYFIQLKTERGVSTTRIVKQ